MSTQKEMDSMSEKDFYKTIPGYEGYYMISKLGQVKSLSRKRSIYETILKPQKSTRGYLSVSLCKDGVQKTIRIHQLMAYTFLNHKPDGNNMVIDHINTNKKDNRLVNLQIISNRDNFLKDRHLRTKRLIGAYYNKSQKQWYSRININGKDKYLGTFKNELECSIAYKEALKNQ